MGRRTSASVLKPTRKTNLSKLNQLLKAGYRLSFWTFEEPRQFLLVGRRKTSNPGPKLASHQREPKRRNYSIRRDRNLKSKRFPM